MSNLRTLSTLFTLCLGAVAAPLSCEQDPKCGPIPGESDIYNTQSTVEPPWPGNATGTVLNTTSGPPGPDDNLFQNLLSAEWIIYNFYQQGVEAFNSSSFTSLGYPNTTYERITEIRDNEAGHLRIFQDLITSNSIKPGPCQYKYPFTDPTSYLALQTLIEVASMAFLTGLELQAQEELPRSALVAIAATESRHETWSLINNWDASPFAGPADTVFPYANQILDLTNQWVVSGSCPIENPAYPSPSQHLPELSLNPNNTKSLVPGTPIDIVFGNNPPTFKPDQDYHAVFFHGVLNVSMPFDTKALSTTIPSELEPLGIYVLVIADEAGAPSQESVVAGPAIIFEDPSEVGLALIG